MFPHPNALIPADIVEQIRAMPGVISLTRAVYMWDLEPDRYESVLGIEDSDVGPGRTRRSGSIDGKPITADSKAVLLDSDFADEEPRQSGRQYQGRRR